MLINPKARSGEVARQEVIKALTHAGLDFIEPQDGGNQENPCKLILKLKNEITHVLIGGGDGSVNHVLPALIETKIPALVVPLGTANNLARTFQITPDYENIHKLILEGETIEVDVGIVNDIHFLNVAGLGLSTEVNLNVSSELKRKIGVFAFILTALKMVQKMNPFRAIITVDGGKPIYTKSWQISVCNGRHYGNGLTIKHNANLEDHKLHLLSTEVKRWWHSVALVSALMSGKYKKGHEITLVEGREITIETRRVFRVDVDGDVKTQTPVKFQVLPRAIKLIIPRRVE